MPKLYEILAVEKSTSQAASKLHQDTFDKFKKYEYFQGQNKVLRMLEDSPQNQSIEAAAYESRELPTTVHETLEYMLNYWVKAEDIKFQKNKTNQYAQGDIYYQGNIIVADVPVDSLLGLEDRLEQLRKLMDNMPTLPASEKWDSYENISGRPGSWVSETPSIVTKTEKITTPVVLYAATDKHPAQVKEVSVDKVVGTFSTIKYNGSASSFQKANVIAIIDELINEVKQARMRANSVEAVNQKIGEVFMDLIMSPFKN